MKEVTLKNGKVVKTPWLRIEEAAAYCGLSRSSFCDHARDLPHSGNDRTRLYNVKILDAWLNGTLDIPFDPSEKPGKRKIKRRSPLQKEVRGLVDTLTGKVYKWSPARH